MTLALGFGIGYPFRTATPGGYIGPRPFKMTVNTAVVAATASDQYKISTRAGETYDAIIDWGDSTQTAQTTDTPPLHTYAAGSGTYQITIYGDFPAFEQTSTDDGNKVVSVDQFGDQVWSTFEKFMYHCDNMDLLATDIPNLSQVTSARDAFDRCYNMVGNASMNNWDVSNIIDFWGMFIFCQKFNIYIGDWKPLSGENFGTMLEHAIIYDQPITNWETPSAENWRYFAPSSQFVSTLAHIDITNITQAPAMISGTMSPTDYDATLNSWSAQANTHSISGITVGFGTSKYSPAAAAAHTNLTVTRGWTITDGGPV